MKTKFWLIAAFLVGGNWINCCAQDVSTGGFLWLSSDPRPDEMPTGKLWPTPGFPHIMREFPNIGYTFVEAVVDDQGEVRSLDIHANEEGFRQAVADLNPTSGRKLKPAQRAGHDIDAPVAMPIYFNPKTARETGPDSTPRLLEACRIVARESLIGSATLTNGLHGLTVPVHLEVDAEGRAGRVRVDKPDDEKFAALISSGLGEWKFAPARSAGKPVSSSISMNILVEDEEAFQVKPPALVKSIRPVYPPEMRRNGERGTVLVSFVVDKGGTVINPMVAESTNPAFEEPAIKAVLGWQFRPGTLQGFPVPVHMLVPIVFVMPDLLHGGDVGFDITRAAKAPAHSQPPRIRNFLPPVYPTDLRRDQVEGEATAKFIIDSKGKVVRITVTKATRPEFGDSLKAAVQGWIFDPALQDGKSVPSGMLYTSKFDADHMVDKAGSAILSLERRNPDRIVAASALDRPPRAISHRRAQFPLALIGQIDSGSALIDFVVDSDGHAVVPRVVEASDPAFGYAAVQAVATWLFEPPTSKGHPVNVRLQAPFEFRLAM